MHDAGEVKHRLPAALIFLALASCSGRPTDISPVSNSESAQISGTVTYREKMALVPDDTIRVMLEDVSLADTPAPLLAETMIAGAGRQVPIPFSLTYQTGWIEDRNRYALRAEIRAADGTLLWTTDTVHPVITNGAPADDAEVRLVRARPGKPGMIPQQPGQTSVFDCSSNAGPFSFTTRNGPGEIALWLPPALNKPYLVLGQIRSPAGARYMGDGVMLWDQGDEAVLEVDGARFEDCSLNRRKTIWEHARLSGVDFRGTGNEPGWYVEIRDAQSIRFVYDYGQQEVNTSVPELEVDDEQRRATYSVATDEDRIEVTIIGEPCNDSMSGESFESRVTVLLDDRTYHGCGRALH